MASGTDKRSKALHNFTMPCNLRWGNQRFLLCMKVNNSSDGGQISSNRRESFTANSSDHHRRAAGDGHGERVCKDQLSGEQVLDGSPKVEPPEGRRRFNDGDGDDGIAAVRQKVMLDLQSAADKMKNAIFKDGLDKNEVFISPAAAPEAVEISRPWNLRTRRAACKNGGVTGAATAVGGGKDLRVDAGRANFGVSPTKVAAASASNKSPIQRSIGGGAATTSAASGEKRDRPKFSVPLSKTEIEEDFMAMVGHRPPRRPKKRTRTIQKQIDMVFPGSCLTEVKADMYKVVESAP